MVRRLGLGVVSAVRWCDVVTCNEKADGEVELEPCINVSRAKMNAMNISENYKWFRA